MGFCLAEGIKQKRVGKPHDRKSMSTFGDDLIQSLTEAVAHAKGQGAATFQSPVGKLRSDCESETLNKVQRKLTI